MNRIDQLFSSKKTNILSVYFTSGYPRLDSTVSVISALADSGVDMIEIGMPFSDPVADGPVIQKSNDIALRNGMSLKLLFSQLADIRRRVDIPLLLMGYLNPIFRFGIEKFCEKCFNTGIDGIILPDLPPEVYVEKYMSVFRNYNLHNIFIVSPQSSPERIRYIDSIGSGFIYMVSSSSTTGEKGSFSPEQLNYFERVRDMELRNPRMIGFGISDRKGFDQACNYADGAIIGSAFVRMLGESSSLRDGVRNFVSAISDTGSLMYEHNP